MTQRTARLTCPKCGANNFDTVTNCWKCSTPLAGGYAPQPLTPAAPVPQGYGLERSAQAPAPVYYPPAQPSGDMNVANRAAFWLGVTIPFVGLPVGWVFMMFDDQKKQRIGKVCVMWSLFAMIFHIAFTMMFVKWTTSGLVNNILPLVKGMSRGPAGGGDGSDGIPGVP